MHPFIAALALPALSQPAPPPSAPAIPPAAIDDTLEVTGDAVRARQVKTRMTVGVEVNGRGPYRFLVDSGADRSVVGAGVARALALPPGRPVTLHGMAGSSRVETVKVEALRVGAGRLTDATLPALPEAYLGAQGLLGIDALSGQRLMLDFDAKTITFQDARRPPPAASNAYEIVITARSRKGQLILTEASAGRVPVYAVVDTGAEVTVGNMALHAAVFRPGRRAPRAMPATLISVTGQTIQANMVVMPEVRIGGLVLRDVPLAFADVPPFAKFGLADRPAILLGTDVLEVFRRVSLDFRRRKIRFLLRRR